MVVPAQNLHALPAHVDSIAGSLCEPLACVCQCLLDPPIVNAGDRVLVVGPGAMGLLSAQVARAQGATVTCAGLAADASRLAVAEALDCRSALAAEVHDEDFDVVVECSGSAGGLATALRAVRRAGSLVQVGIFGREVPVPFDQILYKELTVTSGFASTAASWRRAMELLNARKVELAPLISDVVPLQEWQRALGLVGSGSALKVVIDPT